MKSYRDLDIYSISKKLAVEVHEMSLMLPAFERFEEGSQIRRSSKSVTANIVEGFGRRRYKADYIKHLIYAQVECDETMVHLDFLMETKSWTNEEKYYYLKSEYDSLRRRINKFTHWVEENLK